MQQIQVAWEILQQKYDALVVSESEVYGALLAQDASEEDLELEMESSDVYRNENDKRISSLNAFRDETGLIRLRSPISRRNDVRTKGNNRSRDY
ncbi:hypothetical protein JTB14_007195 [Gonioctena quinquepunctata]|nr:hypothetical protein JTB14_007195 [Gonioctena quinquepunctata]